MKDYLTRFTQEIAPPPQSFEKCLTLEPTKPTKVPVCDLAGDSASFEKAPEGEPTKPTKGLPASQTAGASLRKAPGDAPTKPTKGAFVGFVGDPPKAFSKVQGVAGGNLCIKCGNPLKLQDRQADAWYCPGCRKWCDGQGQPLPEIETPMPLTLEEVEARQLVADLLAAGCGFVTDDGEYVRVTHTGKISTALWLRLEQIGPEFKPLAMKAAQDQAIEAPEWVM